MRLGVVLLGLLVACADVEIGQEQQQVVGGTPTSMYPGVVQTLFSGFLCTATVVSPKILLTAAHCIDHVVDTPQAATGTARFGLDTSMPTKVVGTADVRMHRLYDRDDFTGYDIGLILLDEEVPEVPIPLNTVDLGTVMEIGDPVRVIGYGIFDPETEEGVGTKRVGDIPLIGLAPGHIVHGNMTVNTCQGDSGGPHLVDTDGDGTMEVIAVTSFGASGCRGTSQHSRVDAYLESFVYPVMDRWEGACKLDGTCTTTGCRTPDADCDPCGFNDMCGTDCPQPDLDCPLGRSFRQACTTDLECETRICVGEPGYCSRPCIPGDDDGQCAQDMQCDEVDGEAGGEPICLRLNAPEDDGVHDGGCGCRVGGGEDAGASRGGGPWSAVLMVVAGLGLVTVRRRRLAA